PPDRRPGEDSRSRPALPPGLLNAVEKGQQAGKRESPGGDRGDALVAEAFPHRPVVERNRQGGQKDVRDEELPVRRGFRDVAERVGEHAHAAGDPVAAAQEGPFERPVERMGRQGEGIRPPVGEDLPLRQVLVEGHHLGPGHAIRRRVPGFPALGHEALAVGRGDAEDHLVDQRREAWDSPTYRVGESQASRRWATRRSPSVGETPKTISWICSYFWTGYPTSWKNTVRSQTYSVDHPAALGKQVARNRSKTPAHRSMTRLPKRKLVNE